MATVTTEQVEDAVEDLAEEITGLVMAGKVLGLSDNESTRNLGDALVTSGHRLITIGQTLCAERAD